jgi:glycosyltransferase involved in cell wall biosynthesis
MSVFNGERFLREAVLSIVKQTFVDFEFLIVDDASTDTTPQILRELAAQDARIRIITNPMNLGLTKSLNIALRLASLAQDGFTARMDADDIALPTRLENQVDFLESHSDIGVVGTAYEFVDAQNRVVGQKHPPTTDDEIRRSLIRFNPFLHSSVMIRKTLLDEVNGYDESFRRAQDYDLWMRLAPLTKLANLPEVLMQKRFTTTMTSYASEREQIKTAVRIRATAIRRGQYPLWCTLFLLKPFLAMLLPTPLVRFIRIHIFKQNLYSNPSH